MQKIAASDLDNLALGSAILGSGGGGDPAYDLMIARHGMEKYGDVKLLKTSELADDDLIVPMGFMGAPLVGIEKLPSGIEFSRILTSLEKYAGKKASVLMPFEVGGGNAFAPFAVAAQLGLPVLDADMIGRAFPELQMCSCYLKGIPAVPAFLSDSFGNTVIIENGNSFDLERIARKVTVAMGSCSALVMHVMTGAQARNSVVSGSLSHAVNIGEEMSQSCANGVDPLQPLLKLTSGVCLGAGNIVDIDQVISDGFLKGKVTIRNEKETYEVFYRNEYLAVTSGGQYTASTPDILMLIEQQTGVPLTSESLQYGIKVNIIALPAPKIWQTLQGLQLVGPRSFGYDFDYHPVNQETL